MKRSILWSVCLYLFVAFTVSCSSPSPPNLPPDPTAFVCYQARVSSEDDVRVVDQEKGLAVGAPRERTFPFCVGGTGSSPTVASLPSGHPCAGSSSISVAMDHCFTVCADGVNCTSQDGFWSCKCK